MLTYVDNMLHACAMLLTCALYVTGGLTAVIWTDFIQTIIMLIGASYLMIASKCCISCLHKDYHAVYCVGMHTNCAYR